MRRSPMHSRVLPCSGTSVWWPDISSHINDLVKTCLTCSRSIRGKRCVTYLLVVDYFSRWPEVVKLVSTNSLAIDALKSVFSRHGIPQTLMNNSGPQYASQEFQILQTPTTSHMSPAVLFCKAMDMRNKLYRQ